MKPKNTAGFLGCLALACLVAGCTPTTSPVADDTPSTSPATGGNGNEVDLSGTQPQPTGLYTGTAAVSLTPTFYWSTINGATSYDLYLSTGSDAGASPLVSGIAGVPYILPAASALSGATLYYWKVVARNSTSQSLPSKIQSFTTKKALGFAAPTYTKPANGSSLYPVDGFSWTSVSGASNYRFLCSTASDASGLISWSYPSAIGETASAFFFVPGYTWYWKVVAEDSATCSDDSSAVWSFTPKADGIDSPANLSISGSTISWDAVAGASKYFVILNYGGTGFTAGSLAMMVPAGTTSYDASWVTAGKTIGYAVVALDSSGNTSYTASVAAAKTFIR